MVENLDSKDDGVAANEDEARLGPEEANWDGAFEQGIIASLVTPVVNVDLENLDLKDDDVAANEDEARIGPEEANWDEAFEQDIIASLVTPDDIEIDRDCFISVFSRAYPKDLFGFYQSIHVCC
nr:hypothetical protein CFP56_57346 [Quercus suber]